MRILFLLAVLGTPVLGWATEIHVAPSGDDTNPGTAEAPVASLEAARNLARKAPEPVRVLLHDGTYRIEETLAFSAEDSGAPEHPTRYQALNPGGARLSGGRTLDPASFTTTDDPRLSAESREHVRRLDLTAAGVNVLGTYPDQFRTAQALPELYFNGERMSLAQWPNEGWATIDSVVESGPAPWRNHESGELATFTYEGEHPKRWANVAQLWLEGYWCFDWASETIRVASVKPETRQITLAKNHVYGVGSGNPAPRRYRAVNLLEELDQPGEYYIDRAEHALYFWPPAPLADADVVLSVLTSPLIALDNTSHLALEGLVLEYGAGTAMTVSGGTGIAIRGSQIRNAGLTGIEITGGTKHQIAGCDIHHNGTGGVLVEGGNRKTLEPSGHEVLDNRIYRVSERMRTSAYNVRVRGVGVRVAHNEIFDAPHQAIGVGGNDHLFEYNDIHHVSTESDDCGAFYMGRNPSERGTVIQYNLWREIGSKMAHGSCAVYFDDGTGGQTVRGNIFYKASGGNFGAVFTHGGHDNTVINNIFVDCDQAIGAAPWSDANWEKWLHGDLWQERLLKEVDITRPPYTDRYPALRDYFENDRMRVNRATRNIAVQCKNFVEGNWLVTESLVTMADPGFVDMAEGDFRVRDDAALYELLPDFEAIPFEKIGLLTGRDRPGVSTSGP